jgi:hypothetical protein
MFVGALVVLESISSTMVCKHCQNLRNQHFKAISAWTILLHASYESGFRSLDIKVATFISVELLVPLTRGGFVLSTYHWLLGHINTKRWTTNCSDERQTFGKRLPHWFFNLVNYPLPVWIRARLSKGWIFFNLF